MTALRPCDRKDFDIAIICALPLEHNAVALLFDEFWDRNGDLLGRARGDPNTYTTGRIGKHNVVLALLAHMGKANAAAAVASMRSSYGDIGLVLVVGICGGVPYHGREEILLGDVVISKTVVQYDLGRKYPDEFIRKDTIEDNLSKHDKNIRNFLALFDTDNAKGTLQEWTAHFLCQFQANSVKHQAKYQYPGAAEDKLFESSYRHKHRISLACICSDCHGRMDPVCDAALNSLCDDLGCDERHLESRGRLQARRQLEQEKSDAAQEPVVHIGAIASGDTVMKSGEDRDRIAKKEGVIAFEMEGAGVWEELPCIVVKGVCDYADCHKNKKWQDFATATAASASKAILGRYIQTDRRRGRVVDEPLGSDLGINEDKADVKRLVKTALSDDSSGSWLLVVDNADDIVCGACLSLPPASSTEQEMAASNYYSAEQQLARSTLMALGYHKKSRRHMSIFGGRSLC